MNIRILKSTKPSIRTQKHRLTVSLAVLKMGVNVDSAAFQASVKAGRFFNLSRSGFAFFGEPWKLAQISPI